MKSSQNKWVFQCLVEKDADPVGLVAYAFYKKSKHDLAGELRKEESSERDIQCQVQLHHDSVLRSPQLLEGFRTDAKMFLAEIYDKIESDVSSRLRHEHELKVVELEKKKNKAFEEAVRKLKISAKAFEPPSVLKRSSKWLWNGFAGVLAAVITTVLIGGVLFYTSTDQQKKEVTEKAVQSIVEQLSGG
jgi:3-phosphoglycerate kinase